MNNKPVIRKVKAITVFIPTIPKQASTWSGSYKDLTATPPIVTRFSHFNGNKI